MTTDQKLKLVCRGCGASLEYSAGAQALKCHYCSTVTEIASQLEDEMAESPEMVVPLSIERTRLVDAVYQHIATGKYTPDNLLEHAVFSKVESFYVPAYVYRGEFQAEWTASFGYDRTENYTVHERDSQGNSRPVSKSRTVTDWRPVNGKDSGIFVAIGYAGKQLLDFEARPVKLMESRSILSGLKTYDSSYLSGVDSEAFQFSETEIYKGRAESQANGQIERSVKKHAQGDRQKDWHWTAAVEKTGQSVFLPICHVVYEYEDKSYHVWMDGTNTTSMVADALPVDAHRKRTVLLGFLPAVAAVIAFGLTAMFSEQSSSNEFLKLAAFLIAAALIYGFVRRHAIIDYSSKLRQSLLAQRQAALTSISGLTDEARQTLVDSTKKPAKPWIADTVRDKLILPIASLVVTLGMISTSILSGMNSMPTYQQKAQRITESPSYQPPSAAVPVLVPNPNPNPNPVTVTATVAAPVEVSSPVVPVVPVVAATESVAPPVKASVSAIPAENVTANPVVETLNASISEKWPAVDRLVASINASSPVFVKGDRKAARAANGEGLGALNTQQYQAAIAAFARGSELDPSDIEILNNLGYAYILAEQPKEGISILNQLLLRTPDRSSAWANLSEAMSRLNQESKAVGALRLAVHFSANREKTRDYLQRASSSTTVSMTRAVAERVLGELDNIPAATAATTNAGGGDQVSPKPFQTAAPTESAAPSAMAVSFLRDAEMSLSKMKFDAAKTYVESARRIDPGNSQVPAMARRIREGELRYLQDETTLK